MKRLLALVALVAAVAVTGWSFLSKGDETRQLSTVEVVRGDVEDSITALGTLQPRDYVDVGTQVSGQLRKLHVEIGDDVEQGELLAEIDPAVYEARVAADEAQLRNLKAQLAEREAQRRLAEQQYQRQAGLLKARATSQEAYQNAEASLQIARAQIEALKAQIAETESTLRGNQANLGYTKIYAPMSGTVVSITARQGQTLNANQQAPIILRVADLDTMTVWTQVSEADIGSLKVGMDAYFTTLGDPDRRWSGTLRQILPTPEVVNNVVLYNALFDVENEGQTLKTQMTAQVFFVRAAADDVLKVPLAAIEPGRTTGGPTGEREAVVQVLNAGKVETRTVTLGVRDRVSAEVRQGLSEGEQVVVGNRQVLAGNVSRDRIRTPRL